MNCVFTNIKSRWFGVSPSQKKGVYVMYQIS
jgi:hypothetical protein